MKRFKKWLMLGAVLIGVSTTMTGCNNDVTNGCLIGTWYWLGAQAFVLNEDGTFIGINTDFGALGARWSSDGNGTVSHTVAGFTNEWFTYRFTGSNTLVIQYAHTPNVSLTLRRAR